MTPPTNRWPWLGVSLAAFAMMLEACSTTDDPVDPACTQVSGTRSDLTVSLDPQARPSIDEPSACAFANGTAVTVHAFGKLSFTASSSGPDVCTVPGQTSCSSVSRPAFDSAVRSKLSARFPDVQAGSRCGGLTVIHDWRQANDAVAIVHAELERWDVSDPYPFGVEPRTCLAAQ